MAKLRPASEEEERLKSELYKVADRSLPLAFQKLKETPPLTIPILRRIVQTVEPSEYHVNPTLALQRVIENAIKQYLDDTPIPDRPQLTWRRLAWWLYDPDLPDSYNHRVQDARVFCGLPLDKKDPGRFKDTTADMRLLLARRLLEMERREQEPPQSIPSVGYIRRPVLEAQLRSATRKPGVVLLYGDAGMGKRTLVKEFVRDTPPTKRVMLHADNENLLCLELRKELTRLAYSTRDSSDSAVKARFSELLEKGDAPRYVLIENVDDVQVITDLVPGECKSNVLVIAHRCLQHPLIVHALNVGSMEQGEAAQLARNLAPGLGDKAPNLAHWLGRHPLGIQAACGLLASRHVTIDVLSDMLWHDQATIVTMSASESETNLLMIYEQTLRQFEQSGTYESAIAILEAISCVASINIPRSLLAAYCAVKAGTAPSQAHNAIATSGLKLLRDRGLVTYDDDYVSIHLLTHALWRKVFDDRIRDIVLTLDPLMRWLALRDVIEARPNRTFASLDELEQYQVEHPADEPGGSVYMERLWDSHYYALVRAVEGKLSLEALEYDPARGGYGSRAGNIFKYGVFARSKFGKESGWGDKLETELRYFGISKEYAHHLIWAPFLHASQDGSDSD